MAIAVRQRRLQQHVVEARTRLRVQVRRTIAQLRARPCRERGFPGVAFVRGRRQRARGLVEVVHAQRRARRECREPPAQVLEFAHVARPVMGLQPFLCRRRQPLRRCVKFRRGRGEEARCEQRHVLAAFAQRRQAQPHHVEPMQQIRAEAPVGNQRFQRLVRGRDHAHVHADQFAPADAEEFAFCQHAQQARLQRRRHVADLVEEQRSTIGLFEAPDMALGRAGERAGLVAEQFAFQQFRRNRRGVERDERLVRARRFAVERARDQFLAGAGFAGDEHVQRRGRDPAHGAEQRLHPRRIAEQLRRFVEHRRWRLRRRFRRCVRRPRFRQCARRERDRVVEVEGLGQEFVRAAAEGAGGARQIRVRAHHDHRQLGLPRFQSFQQREPVVAGHAHIGEEEIGNALRLQRGERGLRRIETLDRIAGFAQRGRKHEAHAVVVVHHPDARGIHFTLSCPAGILPTRGEEKTPRVIPRYACAAPSACNGNSSVNTVCPGRDR